MTAYTLRRNRKIVIVMLVYVDDMAAAGPKIKDIALFKHDLGNKVEISDVGELKWILWIKVTHDQKAQTITMNQTVYIQDILMCYGMNNCAPVSMPLVTKE
jgi:hypothetical protein